MSDENEQPLWERVVDPNAVDDDLQVDDIADTPQYSEAEQRAMEKGWVPQDQWQGPQDEWRSAKDFLDRGSFYEKINKQRKELDELRQFQQEARDHLRKLREASEQERLQRIKYAQQQAFEEGNYVDAMQANDEVKRVEQEIEQLRNEQPQEDTLANDMYNEWLQDNPWYEKDADLRSDADAFGTSYRRTHPNATPDEVYKYVTDRVKQTNPTKFNAPSQPAQSQQPGSATNFKSTPRGHGFTPADLNPDQARCAKRFVKLGLFKDQQEYVDSLVASRELG